MQFIPKQLNPEEYVKYESYFVNSLLGISSQYQAWEEMHAFFSSAPISEDKKYYNTFFRWYAILTWRMFNNMEHDVVELACERQIPTVLQCGFDPWVQLLNYLSIRTLDEKGMIDLYGKARNRFLNSEVSVGVTQNQASWTIKQMVQEFSAIEKRGRDSLEMAEFYAKVEKMLTPVTDDDRQVFFADTKEAMDKLIGLVSFFLGVDPSKVFVMVDGILHPERYEKDTTLSSEIRNAVSVNDEVASSISVEPSKEESKAAQEVKKVSYTNIKSMITSRFSTDETGQFTNIEGVLALLDSLAVEYNDDRIRELYYFDESTGTFHWNDELT